MEINQTKETGNHKTTKNRLSKSLIGKLLLYIFAGFVIFLGFVLLFSEFASGVFLMLSGLSIFPLLWNLLKKKWNIKLKLVYKIIMFIAFFVTALITTPKNSAQSGNSTPQNTTPSPTFIPTPTSIPTATPTPISYDTNGFSENNQTQATVQPTVASVVKPNVPTEYESALYKATDYANIMHMSKRGVYDQLTSDYGEKFSAAAAQYAVDNVKADWNANALAKAKDYQNNMHMSPASIHDQLTSDYGEKFTQAEADYAIQHLND